VPAGTRSFNLVTLEDAEHGRVDVLCRCACGAEVHKPAAHVRNGIVRTCGHPRVGELNPNFRHGAATTSTYSIWAQMVQRTTNPAHPRWQSYGGRGIDLDPRWRDFGAFLADMGERPDGLTLERVDNDRGYWPDNCRWATYAEQRHNRRDTVR
jgi:hypothetical protein